MAEVPTTHWVVDFRERDALAQAPRLTSPSGNSPGRAGKVSWRRRAGVVSHVFTHFPLELVVYVARVPVAAVAPPGARWVAPVDLAGEALPALMRKVIAHGVGSAPIAPRSAAATGSSPASSR
jgi:A/G-specific adenine glycosylase